MKKCELCMSIARMFCESDKASLCWDCDAKVHSANFLVAKHARSLLCQSCHSITPWTASGSNVGPTLSLCQACAHKSSNNINRQDRVNDGHDHDDHDCDDDDNDDDDEDEDEYEDEEHDEDSYDGDEEDDGENQVVPFSCNSSSLGRPPRFSTSSTSEETSNYSFFNNGETSNHSRFSFSWR